MKKYDLYAGVLWLLLGLSITWVSFFDVGLGSLSSPDAGLFPFITGIAMIFVSTGMIFMAWHRRRKDMAFSQRPALNAKIPIMLAILCVYALTLEYLGYLISTSILMLYLFKQSATINWRISLMMTVVVMFVSYYFFVVLLQSQLPYGVLETVMR